MFFHYRRRNIACLFSFLLFLRVPLYYLRPLLSPLYSVLIFEVTEPNFPEEEAVRVYVQFEEQPAAATALAELHGRLFGGRIIRVHYFDENRFNNGDLAPRVGRDM
jgi:hypothetical protein